MYSLLKKYLIFLISVLMTGGCDFYDNPVGEDICQKSVTDYDRNGTKIAWNCDFYQNGLKVRKEVNTHTTYYEYDTQGKLTMESTEDSRMLLYYNPANQLIRTYLYEGSSLTTINIYKYSDTLRTARLTLSPGNDTLSFEYRYYTTDNLPDSVVQNNQYIKYYYSPSTDSVKTVSNDGSVYWHFIRKGPRGVEMEEYRSVFFPSGSVFHNYFHYEYDEAGRLIRKTQESVFDPPEIAERILTEWIMEYDEKGNKTRESFYLNEVLQYYSLSFYNDRELIMYQRFDRDDRLMNYSINENTCGT